MPLNIKPCHLRAARDYVGRYHRHSVPPVGGKFSVACYDGDRLCGVAICGRPVAALGLGTVPLRSRAFDQQTNHCREHHCHNEKHHRHCQPPLPVQTQKHKKKNG